jgi:hypothetical protein
MILIQKTFYKFLIYMLFLVYIFFITIIVFSFPIEITEVDPTSEYIEIKNITDTNINLNTFNWSENTSSGKEFFYKLNEYNFLPKTYYVINTKNKINNTGDKISIYDKNNNLIDSIEVPKVIKNKTYQKINNLWEWGSESKGVSNIKIVEDKDKSEDKNGNDISNIYLNSLFISEILPNPEGIDGYNNEFFEIYNGSSIEINLENFYVVDKSGKKFTFSNKNILLPSSYKVFYKKDTNITLNNSNESLFLYSNDNKLISELYFLGNAKSGYSYNKVGNDYFWTQKITPNEKNIKPIVEDIKKIDYKENFRLFSLNGKPKIENLDIKIDKIIPHSKVDSIDLMCKTCENINLKNFQLRSHGEVYKISKDIIVKNGDILHFEFGNKNNKSPKKTLTGWIFFPQLKKLSSTDNVISFADKNGNILDSICYANQNNYFSSLYKKELGQLKIYKNWNSDLKEYNCLDSSGFTKDSFFKRKEGFDTNTKKDFFRSRKDLGFHKYENLFFDKFLISKNFLEIYIINKSDKIINLKNWYLVNNLKWLLDLDIKQNFLYPNQSFMVRYNTSKYKKYSLNNLFLELRDPSGKIKDVLCINKSNDEKFIKKNLLIISNWYEKKLWKKEKKENNCFTYTNYTFHDFYERLNFKKLSSIKNYKLSYRDKISFIEDNKEFENSGSMTGKLDENDLEKEEKIFILESKIESNNLVLFGSVEKNVKFIKIFFPSNNLLFNTQVKKNKFIYKLNKPFKKGRYKIFYSFFDKNKKLITKNTKIINLKTCILCNELKDISFAKIIPNPTGRDKNNEKLILLNNSSISGWIRNWILEIENTKSGKIKKIVLPNLFFEKNEKIDLFANFFKTLPNKNTKLIIKDSFGQVVTEVSWDKARQDEEFGLFSKKFIIKSKTKKSKNIKVKKPNNLKKKSNIFFPTSKKTVLFKAKEIEYIKTKVLYRYNEFIFFKNGYSFIKYKYPSYLPYSDKYFSEGKFLEITIKKDQIKNITPFQVANNKLKN